MDKELTEFDLIVLSAIRNIKEWNKKVKNKKHRINDNDSMLIKETKIYRHINENDSANWKNLHRVPRIINN